MDNLLYLLLGAFALIIIFCLYRNGAFARFIGDSKVAIEEKIEGLEGSEGLKDQGESKSILNNLMQGNLLGLIGQDDGQRDTAPLVMVDNDTSIPDLGAGNEAPSQSSGSTEYPIGNQNMGYVSGILPGQVGTFHPTKNCDRFTCDGCDRCTDDGPVLPRTDDHDRNYPELIDNIRVSRDTEFPMYGRM